MGLALLLLAAAGAAQSLAMESCHYVACARQGSCALPEGPTRCATDTELHEVRCCSSTGPALGQGWRNNSGCSVWADTPNCPSANPQTYGDAVNTCAGQEARLCTVEEVEADCTISTGCGHDDEMIWTMSAPHYIACGRSTRPECEATRLADHLEEHEVRCCSDVDLDGNGTVWQRRSACSVEVYAASNVGADGQCLHDKTFLVAKQACEAAGARLCSVKELEDNCAASTGCNHDPDMVWSGSVAKQAIVAGAAYAQTSIPARLASPNELHATRCCVDTDTRPNAGWRTFDACPGVFSESEVDGECRHNATLTEAIQSCAAEVDGGRLCTAVEVAAGCAAGTGCQFNDDRVWTSSLQVPQYALICGDISPNACDAPRMADPAERHAVRCCVDSDGWVAPGWRTFPETSGCSGVYSDSEVNGVCIHNATFHEAAKHCADATAGGRLCTGEEVISGCARDTGCQFNTEEVWTSSLHLPNFAVLCGAHSPQACDAPYLAGPNELAGVRCCYDGAVRPAPGWRNRPELGCAADLWSETPTDASGNPTTNVTLADAVSMCARETSGGRLCTAAEISLGCASGTGGNLDTAMVWSSSLDLPKFAIVAGAAYSQATTPARLAEPDERHSVRCCLSATDRPAPGWRSFDHCDGVWGESEVGGVCVTNATFWEAAALCAQELPGARLCTSVEMANGCAAGTGCGLNTDRVWTSSLATPLYSVVCGSAFANQCEPPRKADTDERHAVRCCVDGSRPGPGWRTYSDLCPSVWAESEVDGGRCVANASWHEAATFCSAATPGGRLCTSTELARGCTAGTGCQFNTEEIWSSSLELPAFAVMCGAYSPRACDPPRLADVDELHAVRCCYDGTTAPGAGWRQHPQCPGVFAESDIQGQCYNASSWHDASALCASEGARLCNATEAALGCAQGTGCQHDTSEIWTGSMELPEFLLVCGAVSPRCDPPRFADPYTRAAVRCCYEGDTRPGRGWRTQAACPGLWSESEVGGNCVRNATWAEAAAMCATSIEGGGGRLCTASELASGCAAGTGCGFNVQPVWSSDLFMYSPTPQPTPSASVTPGRVQQTVTVTTSTTLAGIGKSRWDGSADLRIAFTSGVAYHADVDESAVTLTSATEGTITKQTTGLTVAYSVRIVTSIDDADDAGAAIVAALNDTAGFATALNEKFDAANISPPVVLSAADITAGAATTSTQAVGAASPSASPPIGGSGGGGGGGGNGGGGRGSAAIGAAVGGVAAVGAAAAVLMVAKRRRSPSKEGIPTANIDADPGYPPAAGRLERQDSAPISHRSGSSTARSFDLAQTRRDSISSLGDLWGKTRTSQQPEVPPLPIGGRRDSVDSFVSSAIAPISMNAPSSDRSSILEAEVVGGPGAGGKGGDEPQRSADEWGL